ncbi:Dbl homology domain-containing protein [Sporodiniella umbellata]|nr:Dbl homology domain-containing protein [Sporodiniella umbellata]
MRNEGSTSDSTPNTTRSDIHKEEIAPNEQEEEVEQNKKEKPTITILNETAQSVLEDYENELFPIPGYDLERDGDNLLKELDREMNRKLYENTDAMFSQPTAQSNYRMFIPKTEFIAMDDFFNQYSEESTFMDLSDTPKEMTEEERALFEVMSDEDKRDYRWNSVVDELLETEESYTRDLYVLCTYFFKVLQNVKYITKEEKNAICRNGNSIAKDQESFCDSLRTAVMYDKELQSVRHISDCFIMAEAYFQEYFDYSMRQDDAIVVYNRLIKTNRNFRDLDRRLHLFHRVSWGTNRLKFEDYLIMPFQRLFRYKLLLQSIKKATPSTSDGYELLEVAENIIHSVATKINSSKAKIELEKKSEIFLSRLQGNWGISRNWYKYFGACSLIGTMEMRYLPKQRISKRICCALFECYLILVKPRRPDIYEPKQWFPIREFTVQDLVDMPNSVNFPWLLRNNSHIFEFSAASQAEKNIWMTNMTNCIERARKNYAKSKTESNEYLVEHLFTSSLNTRDKNKATEAFPKADLELKLADCIALPQGSASLSQSAIFNRPSRSVNRLSIPSFSSMFPASDNLQSPTSGRYLLKGALSDRFVNYKLKQFKVRCDVFDANFKDIYISCLMTSKGCHKKKAL